MGLLIYQSDDEERRKLASLLAESGYRDITSCRQREELNTALGIASDGSWLMPTKDLELMILDISEDRDAVDLVKLVKEHQYYSEIPVIALCANSSPEVLQMAFAYGANDFLERPVRPYELLSRVRSALKMKYEGDQRRAREKELLEVSRQLADLNTVLNRLSLIDSLTGIANRRCFDQSLKQEWRRCYRNHSSLSVVLIDIDFFKRYNDAYGHQAGDECLNRVAQCVRGCLRRPGDLSARYGGEEFVVVLPDTDGEGALHVARTVSATVQGICIPHGHSPISDRVTVSQGVASVIPRLDMEPHQLIEAADRALYEAKRAGRNAIHRQDPDQPKLIVPKAQ